MLLTSQNITAMSVKITRYETHGALTAVRPHGSARSHVGLGQMYASLPACQGTVPMLCALHTIDICSTLTWSRNTDCDYSSAYVTLFTSSDLVGHGMTFTIGRGNDIVRCDIDSSPPVFVDIRVCRFATPLKLSQNGSWARMSRSSLLTWARHGSSSYLTHSCAGKLQFCSEPREDPLTRMPSGLGPKRGSSTSPLAPWTTPCGTCTPGCATSRCGSLWST